jgi:hypothetical protein
MHYIDRPRRRKLPPPPASTTDRADREHEEVSEMKFTQQLVLAAGLLGLCGMGVGVLAHDGTLLIANPERAVSRGTYFPLVRATLSGPGYYCVLGGTCVPVTVDKVVCPSTATVPDVTLPVCLGGVC